MDTDQMPANLPIYRSAPGARLPRMALVAQSFDTAHLRDIRAEVRRSFGEPARQVLGPGMRVAVTAGSRGITNIAEIVRAVIEEVRALDAQPLVVAAMGSHGGATAQGQREVLAGYGVTEESAGCPVVSSMETVWLGDTAEGFAVYVDKAAYESDAIVLLNRVKPHSVLTGELGSGLMKMAAIGLGKQRGADSIHTKGLQANLLPAARMVLERAPVALGIAIMENGAGQTRKLETAARDGIEAMDKRLLAEARARLPNIPFDPLDVLIVDSIGKNFAGTGMDPNVIGMHRRLGGPPEREIRRIVALDLSEQSHGNANGVGMADIITRRLRDKIDWHATYTNALTAGFPAGAKLPIPCLTERDAVALAVQGLDPAAVRAVRISDTAHLGSMWVSEALLAELPDHPGLEQVGEAREMLFG